MRTLPVSAVIAAGLLALTPALSAHADDAVATDLVPVAPGSISLRLHMGWEGTEHQRQGSTLLPAATADQRQLLEGRLSIDFGFHGNWTMHASAPLMILDYNQGDLDASDVSRGDAMGVGDPVFMLAHRFELGAGMLMVGAGASLPIGGVGDEAHVVGLGGGLATSGSLDGLATARLSYRLSDGLAFRATAHGRMPIADDGLQAGPSYGGGAGFMARIWGPVAAGLDLRYLYRGPDRFLGAALDDSGGRWLSFAPGLRVDAPGWVNVELRALVPISEYRNGSQMANGYGFMLTLGKTFSSK